MQVDDGWAGVAWLTLALVNAGFAEQKHRSRLLWFLASLLIGPLATFLIVVVVRREPRTTVRWSDLRTRQDWLGVLVPVGVAALLLGALVGSTTGAWPAWVVAGAGAVLAAVALVLFVRAGRTRPDHRSSTAPPGPGTGTGTGTGTDSGIGIEKPPSV